MSAIVGTFNVEGQPVTRGDLSRMLGGLVRPPAEPLTWLQQSIGFASRRNQGQSRFSRLTVVADARLDNQDELRSALQTTDRSDCGLIARAFARWGTDTPSHLEGDFAFAIWNADHRELFCARDRFGIRPFVYAWQARRFSFASEVGSLVALIKRTTLNDEMIAAYLAGLVDDCSSFYREVARLPPAHSLVVSPNKGCAIRCYWTPSPSSDRADSQTLLECFEGAVLSRCENARSVGALLSGGLDSSSIATTASTAIAPLQTFSAVFDLPKANELGEIQRFTSALRDRLYSHIVYLQPTSADSWPEDANLPVEPQWNPHIATYMQLLCSARAHGVRELLDGLGGDFIVSMGYARLSELLSAGRGVRFTTEVAKLSNRSGIPAHTIVRNKVLPRVTPPSIKRAWRRFRRRDPDGIPKLIRPELSRSAIIERQRRQSTVSRYEARDHLLAVQDTYVAYALEQQRLCATAYGIEPRYPFFDRRLLEACLSVPSADKLHDGWTRYHFRRALSKRLPKTTCWRGTKGDYSGVFDGIVHSHRQALRRMTSRPQYIDAYVDMASLRQSFESYMRKPSISDGMDLWAALSLEQWMDRLTKKGKKT